MVLLILAPAVHAATRTWNPAGDGNFNNSANWSTTLPGVSDIAQFGSASVNGPVLNAPITVGSINFTSTGTGYDLTASNIANALTLMSTNTGAGNSAVASQIASGNTQIDAALIFGAAAAAIQQISQSNGGTLILNGPNLEHEQHHPELCRRRNDRDQWREFQHRVERSDSR